MLLPDRLTVRVTAKICEAEVRTLQTNTLEDSLIIEWE
jgi:hypothetical protein